MSRNPCPHPLPRFSKSDCAALAAAGVTAPQMRELVEILPAIQAVIAPDPTLQDVRAALLELQDAAARFRERLTVPAPSNGRAPRLEALNRVEAASHTAGGDCGEIGRALTATLPLEVLIAAALASMPTTKRHPHTGLTAPVRLIDEALARGWQQTVQEMLRIERTVARPRNIRPSRSGAFLVVVTTCYEAAARTQVSEPDRAIRAYRQELRRERARLTAERDRAPAVDQEMDGPPLSEVTGPGWTLGGIKI